MEKIKITKAEFEELYEIAEESETEEAKEDSKDVTVETEITYEEHIKSEDKKLEEEFFA